MLFRSYILIQIGFVFDVVIRLASPPAAACLGVEGVDRIDLIDGIDGGQD